jgi:hypothetical protein
MSCNVERSVSNELPASVLYTKETTSFNVKMAAATCSEKLVTSYQTKQHHIP